MKIEKKLSARHIVGSARDIKMLALNLPNDGDHVSLYRLIGLVNRVRHVETNFGPSVGLRGEFVATRAKDGAQFASVEFFLPDFASQLVLNALSGRENETAVEIGLDIGLKRNDALAIGYEYTCEPIGAVKASNPMEALIKRMNEAKPLAIAAPTATTAATAADIAATENGDQTANVADAAPAKKDDKKSDKKSDKKK